MEKLRKRISLRKSNEFRSITLNLRYLWTIQVEMLTEIRCVSGRGQGQRGTEVLDRRGPRWDPREPQLFRYGRQSRGSENVPDKTLLKIPVIVVIFKPQ